MTLQSPLTKPRKKANSIQNKNMEVNQQESREKSQHEYEKREVKEQYFQISEIENKSGINLGKQEKNKKQRPNLFYFQKNIFSEKKNTEHSLSPSTSINLSKIQSSSPNRKDLDRTRSTTIAPMFSQNMLSKRKLDKRETFETDRSRLFTRTTSIGQDNRLQPLLLQEEQEQERKCHQKKSKPIKFQKKAILSQQMQVDTGRPKGWALIRDYVKKRIAERKLKKLLFS